MTTRWWAVDVWMDLFKSWDRRAEFRNRADAETYMNNISRKGTKVRLEAIEKEEKGGLK